MKLVGLVLRAIADGVFVSRPMLLIPVWGFSLLGALSYRNLTGYDHLFRLDTFSPGTLLTVFVFSCSVAAVYIVNQLADIETDRLNPGFSLLGHGNIPVMTAITAFVFFGLLSLLVPLLLGNWWLCAFSFAGLLLGIVYSVKPFRLSGRPIVDFLANAVGYGFVAFAAGWYGAGGAMNWAQLFSASAPYIFLMAAGSVSSTIPDIAGDRASAKITTAAMFGPRRAHILATLLLAAALVCAALVHDTVGALCAALALPVYGLHFFLNSRRSLESTYKVGGGVVMMAVAVMVPVFAVVSIVVFIASRVYFKARFQVKYPSLLPAEPNGT